MRFDEMVQWFNEKWGDGGSIEWWLCNSHASRDYTNEKGDVVEGVIRHYNTLYIFTNFYGGETIRIPLEWIDNRDKEKMDERDNDISRFCTFLKGDE